MNAVVNRLLATKKAPQGAFFTPMGDLHNLPFGYVVLWLWVLGVRYEIIKRLLARCRAACPQAAVV